MAQASRVGSHRHGHDLVNIGHDSHLPSASGPIRWSPSLLLVRRGDAASDVVSVLAIRRSPDRTAQRSRGAGSTIIDGSVDGDAVAVLGNVELGPNANVGGDVVAVGGKVERIRPRKCMGGAVGFWRFEGFAWLRPWINHCLLYGRPLALAQGLGWACQSR